MKIHKIRNVDINVCSKEQKIAANLAWHYHGWLGREFREFQGTEAGKCNAIADIRDRMIEDFKSNYSTKGLDMDAVFVALNQGLRAYIERPSAKIYGDYYEIGKDFPIPKEYLEG